MNTTAIDSIPESEVIQKFGNLDHLFSSADQDKDGHLNAPEARNFFPRFGLPNEFLSVVWTQCVTDGTRGMSRQDFARAMKFVYAETGKQQEAMPRGLNMSPYPMGMNPSPVHHISMPIGPSPVPHTPMYTGTGAGSHFAISPQERSKYEESFMKLAGTRDVIAKGEASGFFLLSKVDQTSLRQIWQLADIEGRGMLDKEEFCIAMHLTRLKVKNIITTIPSQLPPVLIPAGKTVGATGFGNEMPSFGSGGGASQSSTPHSMYESNYSNPAMRGASPSAVMPSQRTGGSLQANVDQKNSLIKTARALHDSSQKLLSGSKEILTATFTTQNQLMDKKEQLDQLRQEEVELKEKSEQMKQQLEWSRGEMAQLDTELSGYMGKVETLRYEKAMFERELGDLTREIERLNGIKESGESSTSDLAKETEELEEQVQRNYQLLEKCKEEIYLSKRNHDNDLRRREELDLEVRHLKQNCMTAREELSASKAETDNLQRTLSALENAKIEYTKATEQLKSQMEESQQKKHELAQRVEQSKKDLADTEKDYSLAGNRTAHIRLLAILNSVTNTLEEFDRLSNEKPGVSDSTLSMSSHFNDFPSSAMNVNNGTTTSEVKNVVNDFDTSFGDFESVVQPQTVESANPPSSGFDFGDFDDFGSFSTVAPAAPTNQTVDNIMNEPTKPVTEQQRKLPPAPSVAIASAIAKEREKQVPSFNDDFGDFGDFGASDFKDDNAQRKNTKPNNLDDFGFDDNDFGKPSESHFDKPAVDVKAEFNDDWADFGDNFA